MTSTGTSGDLGEGAEPLPWYVNGTEATSASSSAAVLASPTCRKELSVCAARSG
jgi:hypothetical protein